MNLTAQKTVQEIDESGKTRTYHLKVINPKFIRGQKLTQPQTVLLHLVYIGCITAKTCEKGYGYMYCASIIEDLKKHFGAKIETLKQKDFNQFEQKTGYVKYFLQNPQYFKEILNDNE